MFVYQALIMAAVVAAIYFLAFIIKVKKRKILVSSIIVFIIIGGLGLYAVQYYFGNHFYTQPIKPGTIDNISFSIRQKQNIQTVFSDYSELSQDAHAQDAYGKTYTIDGNGAHSVIEASIYVYTNTKDADTYFEASQKFYENKDYIPLDTLKSKKAGGGDRYLISFIKSQYKDFTDLIYLPSKITYSSDLIIQNRDVIIQLRETSNKPVTNKAAVIEQIRKRLQSEMI